MAALLNYFDRYPCEPGQMRPVHITRDKMVHYIYVPQDPHHADLNWMYASTETMFSGRYHLAPGSMFTPPDVHAGDEYYYMLNGTLTIFNPKIGQVVELKKGECANLPKAAPHKGYNFTQSTCEMLYLIVPSVWQKGEAGPPPYNEEDMVMLNDLRAQQGSRKAVCPATTDPEKKGIGCWPVDGNTVRETGEFVKVNDANKLRTIHGREFPVPVNFFFSTDLGHMGEIMLPYGGNGPRSAEELSLRGDATFFVEEGPATFFFPKDEGCYTVEPNEVMFIPANTPFNIINYQSKIVHVIFSVGGKLF